MSCCGYQRYLHSFPTRRSSDLLGRRRMTMGRAAIFVTFALSTCVAAVTAHAQSRSEEHTSELQSHSDLVCRLLLGKKMIDQDPAGIGIGRDVGRRHRGLQRPLL